MAKPRAGEAVTVNYGWTKPNVMGSDDIWGGQLNADLDGIDSIVHGIDTRPPYVLPTASTTVLGGVKVDGSTITIAGGVITGTPSSGPPVTISATPPSSPSVGALWWDSVGGQLYVWFADANSSQWVVAVNAVASLSPASTTTLGGVKVDGTTIKAAGDGTISTVLVPMGDNRIINGDMRIDQRNNGASGTANAYTVDRWNYAGSQAGKGSWQRGQGGIIGSLGFPNFLSFVSSSAYTPAAGEFFAFYQPIEADMVSDFAWGTANAQPVTLSFWAYSSLTGTFSGSIRNYPLPSTRSYPFSFSIPVANTWTKIVVTIPGDTGGTWVTSGNAGAFALHFDLGSGSTFRAPAGAWAAGNFTGATGSVSVVATNAATFNVTGVKLEIGSVATPYNRQSLAKSMADCQRYYQKLGGSGSVDLFLGGSVQVASAVVASTIGVNAMRAAPTATVVGSFNTAGPLGSVTLMPGLQTLAIQLLSNAAGGMSWYSNSTSAFVTLSAEL